MKKTIKTLLIVLALFFCGAPIALAQNSINEIDQLLEKPQPRITIPGVKFTDIEDVKRITVQGTDGNTYLLIPYLGEYIAAVYRYAVVVIGVFTVFNIIAAGFSMLQAGGDSAKIEAARSKIVRSIVGLLLAVGSYILLYTINPELVQFRHLRVLYVEGLEIDTEGEPDTLSAAQQGIRVEGTTLNSACQIGEFPKYAEKKMLFGTGNGECLRWVKQSVSAACTAIPEQLNAVGAWDVAARFNAAGKFHACNLDGIKDGDMVFMTSMGSNWVGLWKNFRVGTAGCTVADASDTPTAVKNGNIVPYALGVQGKPTNLPPVTHIGIYYQGAVYHQIGPVTADKISAMKELKKQTRNKKNWIGVELTGNFIHCRAESGGGCGEFIAGYGSW